MKNKKVLIAMSGGVDSSVCAHLIKSSGYYAEGITMKLWSDKEKVIDTSTPTYDQNCKDAEAAAVALGIPHRAIALGETFKEKVIDKFTADYINGLTPNPCVECNKHIKFGALMSIADELGFEYLATGHYARIEKSTNGNYVLKKALDETKDQSYFLWSIKKEHLKRLLFPLGEYTKADIRAMAEKLQLDCAHRSDSQDICFIPNGDYAEFIRTYTKTSFPHGSFISTDGTVLGEHNGIINYTVGQRKGLGIALGKPAFVCKKDIMSNTVTLCSDKELYSDTLTAHSVNLLTDGIDTDKIYRVKIRYRHTPTPAKVSPLSSDKIKITFVEPQRAITSGQSVVIYDEDILIGGGIIE